MWNKCVILTVVVAGCALEAPADDLGEVAAAIVKDCPDPANCTVSNNGGVYTTEQGYAGFGSSTGDFMITHFINNSDKHRVRLEGRYQYSAEGYWKVGSGEVIDALYRPSSSTRYTRVDVLEISESMTTPTFTLQSGSNPFTVSGDSIASSNLILNVALDIPGAPSPAPAIQVKWDTAAEIQGWNSKIRTYNMVWKLQTTRLDQWTQYCLDDLHHPDAIVFQQGIGIHAASGDLLVQDSSYVTTSCTNGGIAKAREWGYQYRTTLEHFNTFRGAIHMKRASYCGDHTYYTIANTPLEIWDNVDVRGDLAQTPVADIEALWTRNRALCVNMDNRRHRHAVYPPEGDDGTEWDGWCYPINAPAFKILPCQTSMLSDPSVVLASKLHIVP